MKALRSFRLRALILVVVVLGLGWVASAARKKDPLEIKFEEVSKLLFGVTDLWSMIEFQSPKVKGLFSPSASDGEMPVVSIHQGNAAYQNAEKKFRELKDKIESESVLRSRLPSDDPGMDALVEVSAKYMEILKILHLNYLRLLHLGRTQAGSFVVDQWNLRVNAGAGMQLFLRKELQKRYQIRHISHDPESTDVELFIPPYDRLSLEVAALTHLSSKVQYQKLIHLMHLRDSLVNRWALRRIAPDQIRETATLPPRFYDSFSKDEKTEPSRYSFSRDLEVEDRFRMMIEEPLPELKKVLMNRPVSDESGYRQLITDFYSSFSQLKGARIDVDPVLATLFATEENAVADQAEQVILESTYPQDALEPALIARRIAGSAFRVRRAAILKTLLYRIKTDIAAWSGLLSEDDGGAVSIDAALGVMNSVQIPPEDLIRGERVMDSFLAEKAKGWRSGMEDRIEGFYKGVLLEKGNSEEKRRYSRFFEQTLENAGKVMGAVGQMKAYHAIKKRIDAIPPTATATLVGSPVPLDNECAAAGMGEAICNKVVIVDAFLSGVDARADAGMDWLIPWTPEQVHALFTQKVDVLQSSLKMETLLPEDGKSPQDIANATSLIKGLFFDELGKRYQKAVLEKKARYEAERNRISTELSRYLMQNPDQNMEETDLYRKMKALQDKIESVGVDPEESVLSKEMYEAAGHASFSFIIEKLSFRPPPPSPRPVLSFQQKMERAIQNQIIARRDHVSIDPGIRKDAENMRWLRYVNRAKEAVFFGKIFSLLGFRKNFFERHRHDPRLVQKGRSVAYEIADPLHAKSLLHGKGLSTVRFGKAARDCVNHPLRELSRSVLSQKLLAQIIMEKAYSESPFLRIQSGDSPTARTGLERLADAYSGTSGWNRESASKVFDSLVSTAIRNDAGKIESAIQADPRRPRQGEDFRKIFRSQANQRDLLLFGMSESKRKTVRQWDDELTKETRTTTEIWNERFHIVATLLLITMLVVIACKLIVGVAAAVGLAAPAVGTAGGVGSLIVGVLSGSNFFVQLFFVTTIATQGRLAFYELPAQLQYEKEIANSTVGLTLRSTRVAAPSERASRQIISQKQEELRSTQISTGFGAALQVAFLPLQFKQFMRWSGGAGKAALRRLGVSSPGFAETLKPFSLRELVQEHGYGKGAQMYLERYRSALVKNKPISAVNGGVRAAHVDVLLVNSLSTNVSSSADLARLLEGRLKWLKEKIMLLGREANAYAAVVRGEKVDDLSESLRMFFGKELAARGFRNLDPEVKLRISKTVFEAIEQGAFPATGPGQSASIAEGSAKHLLKAFLLLFTAEKYMADAIFLKNQLDQLRMLESMAGGVVETSAVFRNFATLKHVDELNAMIEWGASHPEFQGTSLGRVLENARRSSKDYRILVDDIRNLTPKEKAIFEAMNGKADAWVDPDLEIRIGQPPSGEEGLEGTTLILPARSLGLAP